MSTARITTQRVACCVDRACCASVHLFVRFFHASVSRLVWQVLHSSGDYVEWFSQCDQLKPELDTCIALLSPNFVECIECDGQFTFALDSGARALGIYIDREGFETIMQTPRWNPQRQRLPFDD